MTPNKEDYLIMIYKLGGEKKLVTNKQVAGLLGIAPASVSEMMVKLGRDGLITYTPYKGSRLTEKGLEICIPVVRSHRLWEVFLMRHLGYTWSEAHEEAHLLEHTSPQRLIDRLDKFLNFPAVCPHGSVIPAADGSMKPLELVALNSLPVGTRSHFRRIAEEAELMDYLESLGFAVGEAFELKEMAPYEGPLTLALEDGRNIHISYKAAGKVFADPA